MPMPQVSYGPPGKRGVTTLMAVGADDLDDSAADVALEQTAALSAAVAIGGFLLGIKAAKWLGVGGVIATLGARQKLKAQAVAVTQPVVMPAPAGWY